MTTMTSCRAVLLCVVGAILIVSDVKGHNFKGYRMFSVLGHKEEDLKIMKSVMDDYSGVEFWTDPNVNTTCFLIVPPNFVNSVEKTLMGNHIECKQLNVNVAKIIEDGMKKSPWNDDGYIIDHHNYHDDTKIIEYLHRLEEKYPDLVTLSYLPQLTHEGRDVATLKVRSSKGPKDIPVVIVEAGIHAREWISPAATLFVIEKLLCNYNNRNPTARYMLDFFEWHFVPVTNPDGYQYSRQKMENRSWRKNRRPIPGKNCTGVDLNRNFDFYFGTTGVSRKCTSNVYLGPSPFSEPETINIKNLVEAHKQNLVGYISVHSRGQILLIPYAFVPKFVRSPKNVKELTRISKDMELAMTIKHEKTYRAGDSWKLLKYVASGTASDWVLKAKEGIFSTVIELRPELTDTRVFNLPPNEIVATGEELLAGLEAMVLSANRTIIDQLMARSNE